jgi:tryptophanyl-tRNA synthetase
MTAYILDSKKVKRRTAYYTRLPWQVKTRDVPKSLFQAMSAEIAGLLEVKMSKSKNNGVLKKF